MSLVDGTHGEQQVQRGRKTRSPFAVNALIDGHYDGLRSVAQDCCAREHGEGAGSGAQSPTDRL